MHRTFTRMAMIAAAVGLAESAAAQVVINEVFENPPNTGDQTWEYIELYGPPGYNLTGYAVVLAKGGEDTDQDNIPDGAMLQKGPEIDEAFSLDGWSIGPNGLFVLYNVGDFNATDIDPFLTPNPSWNPLDPGGERPGNKRYLDGASFNTLHIFSVDNGAHKLSNDGSSTYLLVRRRPHHALSAAGLSAYGPGYGWKKDANPDVDFDSYLDFGDEGTLGVPIYLSDGLDGQQTGALAMQPVQIVDEVAWSNAGGREYNKPGLDLLSGKLLETPGFNPDCISRLRYLGQNPLTGWTVNGGTGELGRTSLADESWIYGETLNVAPGSSTYRNYKTLCNPGLDAVLGTSDDELNYRAPTNPTGPAYSYGGPGDDNPLAAPFLQYSSALDPQGSLRFEPYDMSGFLFAPARFNDAPAGTPLASVAFSLQTSGVGAGAGRQFRFVRGDFNFDGLVDCADRLLIARAAAEAWSLDETTPAVNDRNNHDPSDDAPYTDWKHQLRDFNATLAMIRMNLADGSTGEWNSSPVVDTNAASPTFNQLIAWGGGVTQQDLAAFDAEFPAFAGCVAASDGACCTAAGCVVMTEVACAGAEGAYQGDDSICAANTCCPADFNAVNGVTVQDIFDFLTAWLAGNSSADFNGVNGVTVQDIFDFLTAWLAGC